MEFRAGGNARGDGPGRRGWLGDSEGSFVGRRDALAAIASAAGEARAGRARPVWIEGEAGTGKSTLARRAAAALSDFTVVMAEADELAADLSLGVVGQLLTPRTAAPFSVGLELLDWLADWQDHGPVAMVVEDLHWADAASRPVAFAHPLYQAAIYHDLAPTRRRRLHLAAAGHTDDDTAFWHRVSAADRPDAGLADALEAAGAAAGERQLPALSARYLSWASGLSPGRDTRERRLLQAARVLLADDRADAENLRPRLERCADSRLRDLVLGKLAWRRGDPAIAEQLLRAAAAGPDASVATEALVDLALHYAIQSRGHAALAAADDALKLPVPDPGLARFATALRALGIAQVDGAVKGLDALIPHLPGPADEILPAGANQLLIRGMLRFFAGRAGQAASDLRAVIRLARHGAVPRELPRAPAPGSGSCHHRGMGRGTGQRSRRPGSCRG